MNIKGTAFVTAKASITAGFGEERWNAFLKKLAEKDSYFKNVIMSITPIPVEKHLFFLDEMLKEFFNNDKNQYQLFGRVAAKFSLSPGGPYHSYLLTHDLNRFVIEVAPKLWTTFFDGGKFAGELKGNVAHFKITDIPIKHIYFEYMVLGFYKQAFKLFGKKVTEKKIKSFANGDDVIYYQYEIIGDRE
ncbi:MAG TPA: hypothetical protein PLT45_08855 [Smithella sp.]|nr:hypothetical protein [Smithella sp.]